MDVGIIKTVGRMNKSRVSLQVFVGVMCACFAIINVGCVKPSIRESAADLHSGQSTSGSSLTIWHDSFEAAREQSLVSGKPILADFTGSDWCSWCVKLRKDVLNKTEFEEWARDNVVLLELDFPQRSRQDPEIKAQNEKLASLYGIDSYPTVLMLDAQGNQLARTGYSPNPAAFINALKSQIQ